MPPTKKNTAGGEERRRRQRIYFEPDTFPRAILRQRIGDGRLFSARLKDLSEGGIGLVIERDALNKVEKGNRLKLLETLDEADLAFLRELELVVVWIFDFKSFDHVAFGCQFLGLPKSVRSNIQRYVAATLDISAAGDAPVPGDRINRPDER